MGTDFNYSKYYKSKPQKASRYSSGQKRGIVICAAVIFVAVIVFVLLRAIGGGERTTVTAGGTDYYAVCLGTYADENSARIAAEKVRTRGAAGYIAGGDSYRVLAACYASKKDAEQVIENLKKSLVSASLFTVSVPRCRLQNISKASAGVLLKALGYYSDIYGGLYALTNNIDTGETDADGIYDALDAVARGVGGITAELNKLTESDAGPPLAHIKALYISTNNRLETINLSENYFTISVNLRYNYIKIIYDYIELFKEINT